MKVTITQRYLVNKTKQKTEPIGLEWRFKQFQNFLAILVLSFEQKKMIEVKSDKKAVVRRNDVHSCVARVIKFELDPKHYFNWIKEMEPCKTEYIELMNEAPNKLKRMYYRDPYWSPYFRIKIEK